jgi:hypothetical protein
MQLIGTKQVSQLLSQRSAFVETETIIQFKNNPEAFLASAINEAAGCCPFAVMREIGGLQSVRQCPNSLKFILQDKELRRIASVSMDYVLGNMWYEPESYIAAFTQFKVGYFRSGQKHELLKNALISMLLDKEAMTVIVRSLLREISNRRVDPKASLQHLCSILFANDQSLFKEFDEVTNYQASYILGTVCEELGEFALALLCYEKSAGGSNVDALYKLANLYSQDNPNFKTKKNNQLVQQYSLMANLQDSTKFRTTSAKWNDDYQAINFHRMGKIRSQGNVEFLDSAEDNKDEMGSETQPLKNLSSANHAHRNNSASSTSTVNNANINSGPTEHGKVRGDNEIRSLTPQQKKAMLKGADEIFDL